MTAEVDLETWLDAWDNQSAAPKIALADPEVEVIAVTLGIEGRRYHGHDGLRQWMRDVGERFGARTRAWSVEPLGEDAVMITGTLFLDDGYGNEQEQRYAMVVHLREGKARWIGTFFSAADARAAYQAGLTGPGSG